MRPPNVHRSRGRYMCHILGRWIVWCIQCHLEFGAEMAIFTGGGEKQRHPNTKRKRKHHHLKEAWPTAFLRPASGHIDSSIGLCPPRVPLLLLLLLV